MGSPVIVFRCDAASLPEIGTGHVVRDLLLAKQLIADGICRRDELLFVTRKESYYAIGQQMVIDAGMPLMTVVDTDLLPNSSNEGLLLAKTGADLIVIDRLSTTNNLIKLSKKAGAHVVTFDDIGDGALEADLVINAILEASPVRDSVRTGYKYLILPKITQSNMIKSHNDVNEIVVSPGGYDARDVVGFVLSSLLVYPRLGELSNKKLTCLVGSEQDQVISQWNVLAEQISLSIPLQVEILIRTPDFSERLANADMAIVAGGLTAFECVSMGIPIIGLPQYEHQLETLKKLEKAGVALLASEGMDFRREIFNSALDNLIGNKIVLVEMSRKGPVLVDGRGAQRVANELGSVLTQKG